MGPRTYSLNLDDSTKQQITRNVESILFDDNQHPRKYRRSNYFKKPSQELEQLITNILIPTGELADLKWYFEVFYSVEPVGLHNDRNFFPESNELCQKGLLIPIRWDEQIAGTRFYDLYIDSKVNWSGINFKTLSGQLIPHDSESIKSPKEFLWSPFEALFFDSRQIHDASPFPTTTKGYKLSINALGYSRECIF